MRRVGCVDCHELVSVLRRFLYCVISCDTKSWAMFMLCVLGCWNLSAYSLLLWYGTREYLAQGIKDIGSQLFLFLWSRLWVSEWMLKVRIYTTSQNTTTIYMYCIELQLEISFNKTGCIFNDFLRTLPMEEWLDYQQAPLVSICYFCAGLWLFRGGRHGIPTTELRFQQRVGSQSRWEIKVCH